GHPAPFDQAHTLRMASAAIVAAVRDLEGPSRDCPGVIAANKGADRVSEYGDWPGHLSPGLPYEFIGNSRDACECREELEAAMSPEMLASIQPPSDAALAIAKQKLREVCNPVGRMLVATGACLPTPLTGISAMRLPAEEVATKVSLAVRLYFDRFGRAPSELSQLIAAGLLSGMPIDPFAGLLLRYSSERGLLWSVGLDGKDGNGDPAGDIVWRMPVTGGN
ncbi:MAG TPA: hypothetical protein PK867_25220, partial [Pirellulales bacterium]|nr:hypothetical protein [Pirellulales bacterium]